MPKCKVSDFIFEFLRINNASNIFLVPGGGNMHLTDSVKRNKKLSYTSFFHEQSATIAAESYSRTKNNLGVALVTSGPGSTNAITGVAGAWIESIPLIIISGQVKTSDLIGKKKIRQNGPQEVEIIKNINNITKFSITIKSKKNVIKLIRKAVKEAISERAGPVWIDIPLDIQASQIIYSKKDLKKIQKTKKNYKFNLSTILDEINNHDKPIILAGHGVRLSGSKEIFLKLIKKLNIPVLTTWNSIDLLEYGNRLNLGSPGVVARRHSNLIVQKSDLIISLGSSLNKIIVAFNERDFGRNAKKIIIDIDKFQLKKIKIPNSKKIHSCCNYFLNHFNNFLKNKKIKSFKPWIDECLILKRKYSNEFIDTNKIGTKIDHYYFTNLLSKSLVPNQIVSTGSSGLGIEIFYTFFETKKNQRIFLTSGLGAMGYGIPSSIGTCISNNKKKTILVESDGSFMFNLQELSTIVSYKLPIKIILLNNQGYASIRNTHKNYFKSRYVGTGNEDGIKYPNYKNLCKAFNIQYLCIKNKRELSNNLKKKFIK
tara:strand:+ start:1976 stop:3598 length:1623 start_codon:yes stop_codon:yes gene_type:complete